MYFIIGFTGTQRGMTPAQRSGVKNLLSQYLPKRIPTKQEFHHGDCEGSDEEAHGIATSLGYETVGHPPLNESKRAFCKVTREEPAMQYLNRDQAIVDVAQVLIATPKEDHMIQRSGTWATVRRARKKGIPVVVIYPNGRKEVSRGQH